MAAIPKLKRKISSFLAKEDGKISKENLIKAGIFIASIALFAASSEGACSPLGGGHQDHCNTLTIAYNEPTATGTHGHGHNSHGSHGSHGSHCSFMC